jgi:ribosomal protein S18 acetylase RimI-like enzyme
MSKYLIRSLQESDLDQMYDTFIEAFSDYQISFNLTRKQFDQRFLEKLNISFNLSVGAFHEEKLVGFIFHALNEYRGEQMLYNGGTGVVPAHRGQKLVNMMYDHIKTLMRQNDIKKSVLEVITTNHKAYKAYEKEGFVDLRLLKCFKLTSLLEKVENDIVQIELIKNPDYTRYKSITDYEPSFIDTFKQLPYNSNDVVIEARMENEMVGFMAFQPHLGRISQLAVNKSARNKGIGTALLLKAQEISENKNLTLLNVDEEEFDMINFLINRGFENQLDQYEMYLQLDQ